MFGELKCEGAWLSLGDNGLTLTDANLRHEGAWPAGDGVTEAGKMASSLGSNVVFITAAPCSFRDGSCRSLADGPAFPGVECLQFHKCLAGRVVRDRLQVFAGL